VQTAEIGTPPARELGGGFGHVSTQWEGIHETSAMSLHEDAPKISNLRNILPSFRNVACRMTFLHEMAGTNLRPKVICSRSAENGRLAQR
jgi:hypothetical protein